MLTKPLLRQPRDIDIYDDTHQRNVGDYRDPLHITINTLQKETETALRILVIGPGKGQYDALLIVDNLGPHNLIDLVDPSQQGIEFIQKTLSERTSLPTATYYTQTLDAWLAGKESQKKYHLIIAFSVLHHLPNWRDSLTQLIAKNLDSSGMLLVDEWIGGNPLHSLDMNCDLGTDASIRRLFLTREAETGIFWDPELRGHRMRPIVSWLQRLGLSFSVSEPNLSEPPSRIFTINVWEALKNGSQYAITRWGHGQRLRDHFTSAAFTPCSVSGAEARARILSFSFGKKNDSQLYSGDEDWAAARIHQHFATSLQQQDSPSGHAERRILQALQLMVHYGVVCADTLWCIPIRARISEDSLEPMNEAEPPSVFLLQDCDAGWQSLQYALLNMRRLLTEVNLPSRAITTEILRMLSKHNAESKYKTAVFHVRKIEQEEALSETDHKLFQQYTLGVNDSHSFQNDDQTSVQTSVAKLRTQDCSYRFGEFEIHDLANLYKTTWQQSATTTIESTAPSSIESLLREFSPMLRSEQVLHLVFSTYKTDVTSQGVEDHVIGGFLLLEQDRKSKGPTAAMVDEIRFTRLQLIARLLQAEVLDYLRLRNQERLAESAGWRKGAQLQTRIKEDLDQMLEKTHDLSMMANRIRSEIETSRVGFLSLGNYLERAFDPKATPFYYGLDGEGKFRTEKETFDNSTLFTPIHSSSSVPSEYRDFIAAWSAFTKLLLKVCEQKRFREKWLNKAAEISNDLSKDAYNFLKLLIYKPESEPQWVYDCQIVFALGNAIAQWSKTSIVQILTRTASNLSIPVEGIDGDCYIDFAGTVSNLCGQEFSHNGGGSIFDPSAPALSISQSTRSGDVLGSLISICDELAPASHSSTERVSISSVHIHPMSDGCMVEILCDGCLPERAFLLDDLSNKHGLRSCFELLCRAANQRQPERIAHKPEHGDFRKGFLIYESGGQMTMYYGLERVFIKSQILETNE